MRFSRSVPKSYQKMWSVGAFECGRHQSGSTRIEPPFSSVFDKIVVDAPCSGEGMFRKDPVALEEWQAETPDQCDQAKRHFGTSRCDAKTGGQLIYSHLHLCPRRKRSDDGLVNGGVSLHDRSDRLGQCISWAQGVGSCTWD